MGGGLLNLVAYGSQNVILNGNPSKTFFKCTYSKYTNFGMQKFRIDYDGLRTLRMTEPSTFRFQVPRYGDLLMDTYLVVSLPTIWSPIVPRKSEAGASWWPYEFKWIENLGAQLIKSVRFSVGGQVIQEFSGQYLYNVVQRDFDAVKKELFDEMTGNVAELNDPANALGRVNCYPSAYPSTSDTTDYLRYGPEPSIRGRELFIPLNVWFTLAAKMAFPLVSLQYQELSIEVDVRPVCELFVVRYVGGADEGGSDAYHQPNFNDPWYQFYRFLQPPPYDGSPESLELAKGGYTDTRTDWNADIHLLSTYAFLSDEEVRTFAARPQQYLIREVYEHNTENVTGSSRVELRSTRGMVSSWMWYFQRSDAYLRNQWSNYTNWAYSNSLPSQAREASSEQFPSIPKYEFGTKTDGSPIELTPQRSYDTAADADHPTGIFIGGPYSASNVKHIMESWALLFDGKYRENSLRAGVLSYVEKYVRTSGSAPAGLYCYNFGLHTDPFDFQPSGAVNLSKFTKIEFEITTIAPPLDPLAQSLTVCAQEDGVTTAIGVNKPTWRLYDYNFNLTVMEERYNVLTFVSGTAGLMYAR
jgi:hypothetical protein